MMEKIKIKNCEKTCGAFPSQWDMIDDNGRELYARLRHGIFYVSLIPWTIGEKEIISIIWRGENNSSDNFGLMSTSRMIELTKDLLDFTNCKIIDEYNED